MRGSPLLRTFLTALALVLAAVPLWRITQQAKPEGVSSGDPVVTGTDATPAVSVPFRLVLSAAASRVIMRDEMGATLWQSRSTISGEMDGTWSRIPRTVMLEISWADSAAPRYFAKLQLDPPRRASLTHVFDAAGDIDDLWELP